jgi:hypothetical protein
MGFVYDNFSDSMLKVLLVVETIVAEPKHLYAAQAPRKNFVAAPAPTLK